jgi:hypothetical protein
MSILGMYKDYKLALGGVGMGVMFLSSIIMWLHPPQVSDELRGAYRLWGVYLMIGAVLTGVIMMGYIQGVH